MPSTLSSRLGKRGRAEPSPSPPPLQQRQQDDLRPSSDEYDDLLDFDLGSSSGGGGGIIVGTVGGESVDRAFQQAEPLFLPASPSSSSPAAGQGEGGDVEMADLAGADTADVGQEVDLDWLLDLDSFGRSPASKRPRVEETVAPAQAQGSEMIGGGSARAAATTTAGASCLSRVAFHLNVRH